MKVIKNARYARKAAGSAPRLFFSPDMGVVNYPPSSGMPADIRKLGDSSPDWYRHVKIIAELGIRAVRMKDFVVNPN